MGSRGHLDTSTDGTGSQSTLQMSSCICWASVALKPLLGGRFETHFCPLLSHNSISLLCGLTSLCTRLLWPVVQEVIVLVKADVNDLHSVPPIQSAIGQLAPRLTEPTANRIPQQRVQWAAFGGYAVRYIFGATFKFLPCPFKFSILSGLKTGQLISCSQKINRTKTNSSSMSC